MKIKITRPDGTIIEAEGSVDELLRLVPPPLFTITAPPLQYQPLPWRFTPSQPWFEFVPTVSPGYEPYINPSEPLTVSCGCGHAPSPRTASGAFLVDYPPKS